MQAKNQNAYDSMLRFLLEDPSEELPVDLPLESADSCIGALGAGIASDKFEGRTAFILNQSNFVVFSGDFYYI